MTSKRLWIVEGPDGSGKSTLVNEMQRQHPDARVVHLGPFPNVTKDLGRLYVEAMLPALQGLAPVILDRSWLSEPIYAEARRHAPSRLGSVDLRMLERVAARCRTTLIRCLPPYEACAAAYCERRAVEYLKTESQLKHVYLLYANGHACELPQVIFDRTAPAGWPRDAPSDPTAPHPLSVASAGYLDAPVLLVGDRFAEHKEHDPLQQYPFVSFSDGGCSRWLTAQLERAGVGERQLLWVNADQDLGALLRQAPNLKLIVALGEAAAEVVNVIAPARVAAGAKVVHVPHPQHQKRFGFKAPYPLIDVLKEARL